MFASYDRLVKVSSALLMTSRFYLFVGDGGFELRPCPSREDLREELDKSEFDYYNVDGDGGGDYVKDHVDGDDDGDDDEDNLDESEFDPDFDEFPDFEGGETPHSVIAKPECFMTQDKRNTSSRSPWFWKDGCGHFISWEEEKKFKNQCSGALMNLTCSSKVTIKGGAFEGDPFCLTTRFKGIFRFMFILTCKKELRQKHHIS